MCVIFANLYFKPPGGVSAPWVPGKTKTPRSANLHSARNVVHLIPKMRGTNTAKAPFTNKGEMSYNIQCRSGIGSVVLGGVSPVQACKCCEHLWAFCCIFVFRVDYTTEPLVMQANFARTFRKIQAGRDFLPACCYTSMVLASRRWDCVYRIMLSPSLRTRSPLGIRMLPFRRTMTMMVWREMSSSRMGRPFQGF